MGQIFGQITHHGAIFEAKVMATQQRVEWLKAHGRQYPPPSNVRALVDTGASGTCIDCGIVSSLGLDPAGATYVHTPSTMGVAVPKATYDVSVVLGDGRPDPRTYTLELVETDLASQGIDLLIGRDILSKCMMNYDGPNGIFSIKF